MDNISTPVPSVKSAAKPVGFSPDREDAPADEQRTHNLRKGAALTPRSYPRFGEEDRTSGSSRIATIDKRKYAKVTETPGALAAVMPASGDPLDAALKEIAAGDKVVMVDLPRPMKKPGQAEHAVAYAAKLKIEADKVAADLALNNPTFVEPVISQQLGAGEIQPPAPINLKVATADLPRPLPKPGQKHDAVAVDKTTTIVAKPEKSASSLSNVFMNNLGKVYGKKVPSAMGETHRYGYIVD
jgi:hypothetical protein